MDNPHLDPAATYDKVAVCRPRGDGEGMDGIALAVIRLRPNRISEFLEECGKFGAAKAAFPGLCRGEAFDACVEWFEVGSTASTCYEHGDDPEGDAAAWENLVAAIDPGEGNASDSSEIRNHLARVCDEAREWRILPASWFPSFGNLRTECGRIQFDQVGDLPVEIRWRCYVKHTDIRLGTPAVGRDELEAWSRAVGGA